MLCALEGEEAHESVSRSASFGASAPRVVERRSAGVIASAVAPAAEARRAGSPAQATRLFGWRCRRWRLRCPLSALGRGPTTFGSAGRLRTASRQPSGRRTASAFGPSHASAFGPAHRESPRGVARTSLRAGAPRQPIGRRSAAAKAPLSNLVARTSGVLDRPSESRPVRRVGEGPLSLPAMTRSGASQPTASLLAGGSGVSGSFLVEAGASSEGEARVILCSRARAHERRPCGLYGLLGQGVVGNTLKPSKRHEGSGEPLSRYRALRKLCRAR